MDYYKFNDFKMLLEQKIFIDKKIIFLLFFFDKKSDKRCLLEMLWS